ncbi:hypothetical protein ABTK26_20750, partial [Acinetobacter baumannii]
MMKNRILFVVFAASTVSLFSCSFIKKKPKDTTGDGQLHGVAPSAKPSMERPRGMVYIPPGTFHMGPSDEDIN